MRILSLASILLALSACTTARQEQRREVEAANWRSLVTAGDVKRLRDWRSAFGKALAAARAAGHGREIDAEGRLLQLDAAVPGALPNGDYSCRIIKLGARGPGALDYVAYPGFHCRVSRFGAVQYFAKLDGSQRPNGRIFRADPMRSVFLGMLMLGDETRAMRYGSDPDRDLAGWVEQVEPAKWRILLPSPRFESLTDVVELVPAGAR